MSQDVPPELSTVPPDTVEFSTPWFSLISRRAVGHQAPFYAVKALDYVSILPVTTEGEVLLVEQYRPAVRGTTVELPGGHVELGETPEQAAKKELLEETGFIAASVQPLGVLWPDTGRMAHRMWCFFARDVTFDPSAQAEEGIAVRRAPASAAQLIGTRGFDNALSLSVVTLAVSAGLLPWSGAASFKTS